MMTTEPLAPTRLRCEYLTRPLGIDETAPRLGWNVECGRAGARQTAYRVRVASSPEILASGAGDLWDSGRVEGGRTQHVAYAGRPLGSRTLCHWCVEVWDDNGASVVSNPEYWSMGLLGAGDWSAKWIAADPAICARDAAASAGDRTEPGTPALFRKVFTAPAGIRRATLYASARGLFEIAIGGARVGEDLFAPEWTDYNRRIHYRTYDVTAALRAGDNVVTAMLGDGWWSGYVGWQKTRGRYGLQNSLIAQIEIELDTGARLTIGTDETWRCETGPVLSSDFMMGEVYDARREHAGHGGAAFNDSAWLASRVVDAPPAALVAQRSEPVRVTEVIHPVSVREIAAGTRLFDLGQNISGWVRLTVCAPAGTRLTIRHGERLDGDDLLYTENLRRAKATDVYICSGAAEGETWEPRFTFHGFQYFEISGLPEAPHDLDAIGCVVHSALPPAGHFECAHAGVNRLWLNGLWSQRDNFLSVPTDCPQRDERLGWTGDAEVFMRTASYNMDVAAFFTKWMIDIEDAQTPGGIFPDTAPRLREDSDFIGLDGLGGGAGWADAGIIVPHTLWRVYGDERIIARHWPAMVAWLDYLERVNPEGIRCNELGNNYGDWLCIPSDTSFRTHSPMKNLLATAFWADDAAKMAEMAQATGRHAEAARFKAMFAKVRDAFQRAYHLGGGRLAVETQTAYLLALAMNLLPEDVRQQAAGHLVDNIRALDWHLSTGFIGIRFLNPILTEYGHADVAYRLLLQDDYPSWLYPVQHGATTIWERWNGWTEADGFFNPHMNSFNHYSLGSIGEWLFRHVTGIEAAPDACGFQRFVLKPWPDARLGFARARYRGLHGEITSEWRLEGGTLTWSVCIPANTTARVHVPCGPGATVLLDGSPLPAAAVREGDRWVLDAAAGHYTFTTKRSPH